MGRWWVEIGLPQRNVLTLACAWRGWPNFAGGPERAWRGRGRQQRRAHELLAKGS